MGIERRESKNGKKYYYDTDKKRFSSRKEFIKENVSRIQNGQINYDELNTKEKQSFNAQKRTTYKGRFVPKEKERIILDISKEAGINVSKGDELSDIFDTNILKEIEEFEDSGRIYPNTKRKTMVDIFNIQSEMGENIKKGNQVVFIDEKGKIYFGQNAIDQVDEYEQRISESGDFGNNPIFIHEYGVKYKNGELIYTVDVSNTTIIESD